MPLVYPTAFFGGGGTIAFPTLRATSTYRDTTFSNSHDVTLPSGTTTGDLVIMFGLFAGTTATTVNVVTPPGWERIAHYDLSAGAELNVYWTIASGPLSTVEIDRGTDAAITAKCNAYSFSAHSSVAPAVSSTFTQQFPTANPDPPSLTVPAEWGGSPHVTWLTCLWKFGDNTTVSASANYTNLIGTTDGETRMASARRNLRATTEDPGVWTMSNAVAGGTPFTIAVRGPE